MVKPTSHITGIKGEELACQFLTLNGYTILHQNWRVGHLEIDIIAQKDNILHFIEVKTRHHTSVEAFGAQRAMSHRKLQRIIEAANSYISTTFSELNSSVDLLAIDIVGEIPSYNFREGVQWDEIPL